MANKIRVGLIGGSLGQGWAAISHLPALQSLQEFEIIAVSTTRMDSAQKAAQELGARHAFDDSFALARHPDVDLVSVVVKVPEHHALASAAIDAGKHVYCEWPLARNSNDAKDLLARAEAAGVKHAVGLQARMSPVINKVRSLLRGGFVGDVLSCTLIAGTPGWGAAIDLPHRYILDKVNGATLLSIVGGHSLDALVYSLGEFDSVSATATCRRTDVRLIETGATVTMNAEDQIALSGRLACGAVVGAQFRGGRAARSDLLFEIIGTEGELAITSLGNIQMAELQLAGSQSGKAWGLLSVAEPDLPDLASLEGTPAYNVSKIYRRLSQSIRGEQSEYPDFQTAVDLHHLLESIEGAAASGRCQLARSDAV